MRQGLKGGEAWNPECLRVSELPFYADWGKKMENGKRGKKKKKMIVETCR